MAQNYRIATISTNMLEELQTLFTDLQNATYQDGASTIHFLQQVLKEYINNHPEAAMPSLQNLGDISRLFLALSSNSETIANTLEWICEVINAPEKSVIK